MKEFVDCWGLCCAHSYRTRQMNMFQIPTAVAGSCIARTRESGASVECIYVLKCRTPQHSAEAMPFANLFAFDDVPLHVCSYAVYPHVLGIKLRAHIHMVIRELRFSVPEVADGFLVAVAILIINIASS